MGMTTNPRCLLTPNMVIRELAKLCDIDVPPDQPSAGTRHGDFGMRLVSGAVTIATNSVYDILNDTTWLTVSLSMGMWARIMAFKIADLAKSLDAFSAEFLEPIATEYRETCKPHKNRL
jgi:hypothetical protein